MITVDQALTIVLERVEPLGAEPIELEDALGRVLMEDVYADIDLPPFDRARMDGYAVRSSDVTAAPVTLRVIGEIAAGASFTGQLKAGEAVKIFTGAPVPAGADAVQKIEVTEASDHTVEIKEPVKPGQFITAHASEISRGERVLKSKTVIGSAQMAVLASFGYSNVKVSRTPSVAVLSTGSELVPVSIKPTGAQIRNSNSYSLASYAELAGAQAEILPTVGDTPRATREALLAAAENRDLVITSGGVSMGDYDLVEAALLELGAEIFFNKVRIRPGKPIVFARRGDTWFFCLPGNPVSTSVTFNVFVKPVIRRMLGYAEAREPTSQAKLVHPLTDVSNRRSYLPARLSIEGGRAVVEPLKWGGSSDLVAFVNANALIIVAEDVHEIAEGRMVDVLKIGDCLA